MIASLALGGCSVEVDANAVRADEIAGARMAFKGNIAAIQRRDGDAYLSHYVDSPDLVIAGPDSLRRGFAGFAAERRANNEWPDTLIAGEPQMVWLGPGVVYGAYHYTRVQGKDTTTGMSERVLVKTAGTWKVAVTSVIQK